MNCVNGIVHRGPTYRMMTNGFFFTVIEDSPLFLCRYPVHPQLYGPHQWTRAMRGVRGCCHWLPLSLYDLWRMQGGSMVKRRSIQLFFFIKFAQMCKNAKWPTKIVAPSPLKLFWNNVLQDIYFFYIFCCQFFVNL